jgi:hypothetical protein
VDGLYLCGSGTHPGGGVMGIPGLNASKVVVADHKSAERRRKLKERLASYSRRSSVIVGVNGAPREWRRAE